MVEKMEFWPSALIGFVVMLILSVLPLPGPLIGGFVAGFLFKEGIMGGAKVGLATGIFGAIVISVLLVLFGTLFLGAIGLLAGLAGTLALVALALYNGLFALVGGAIGGLVVGKI
jgi:hypothetical protein